MQGWYWDYPKTGQGSYNWSDTLRLKAASLGQAGFTHVWYPPFAGNGNKSGGYDPRDLFVGPSQTSLGTLSEITSMINSFTANGITPVADMVYNHRDAGRPENNPAVKEYMLNYAGANNGNCQYGDNNTTQTTTYKQPFPSDRVRMVVPIGGSTGLGAGNYYININSRSGGYLGKRYLLHITTNRAGGGQAWDFANGCSPKPTSTTINAPNGSYPATLRQGYWVEMTNNQTEFNLNLQSTDFNAAGDSLFIQAVNLCGDYTDHRIWKIWYGPGGYDIADQGNQSGANYRLLFQTYTNFSGMPSGRGGLDWRAFRPNWNGLNVPNVGSYHNASRGGYGFGGASGTCLGPQWSQQSLDYFYDYDHSQGSARDTLLAWTRWTYDRLASKGLRVDAVKHFDPQFMADMLNDLYTTGRTPDLVVGEWYGENLNELKGWVDNVSANLNSLNPAANNAIKLKVFDFSLRRALKDAIDNGANARAVYFTGLRDGRGMSGFNIMTFLNNHDFRSSNPTYGDALVHTNPTLGYAYLLTNNQLGVPTVFYPDYYGYPARNSTFGSDTYAFDYHPTGLPAHKTEIDRLINVLRTKISGSTGVSYLNHYGGTGNGPGSNAAFSSGDYNRVLIYQLSSVGAVGGKDVIVAINFDSNPLRVNHKVAIQNGVAQGTRFGDILGRSAFPFAVVNNDAGITDGIYIDLPAKSYSVWVQDYVPLSVTLASTTACLGQSNTLTASITGGTAPFTYSFSTGATAIPGSSSLASVSATGPYSVTVTDDFGVSVTATISSTFNPVPTISQSGATTHVACAGISNGAIAVAVASGTAPYTVSAGGNYSVVLTSAGTASLTGLPQGTYVINVVDATGCSAILSPSVSLTQPAPLSVSQQFSAPGVCAGESISLTATPTGGMAPYDYAYSPALANSATVVIPTIIAQGGMTVMYRVTVTDANGCTATANANLDLDIYALPTPTLTAGPSSTLTCSQTSLTLTAGGGSSYSFVGPGVVSQDNNSGTAVVNASGTYTVVVTSANACTASATVTIESNTAVPSVTLSGTNVCAGLPVPLLATSGLSSYTFAAQAPGVVTQTANTASVSGLTPGIYSFTVLTLGTNGCVGRATRNVTVNPNPTVLLTNNGPLCDAGLLKRTLTLTATASGGTTGIGGTYSNFRITGPVSVIPNNTLGLATYIAAAANVSMAATGTYTVVVTDARGCTATNTTNVTVNTSPSAVTVTPAAPLTFCANNPVTFTATATATTSLAYQWYNNIIIPGATGTTFTPPASSTLLGYSVQVTDANGCANNSGLLRVTIQPAPATPVVSASPGSTLTCAQTSLTLTATGGGNYTFVGPGIVTQDAVAGTAEINTPGVYTVVVTNGFGCTTSTTTTIDSDTAVPSISLPTFSTATANVTLPADLVFTISNGQTPYTIALSSLPAGLSVSTATATERAIYGIPSQAGVYPISLTATGANGCSIVSGAYALTVSCPSLTLNSSIHPTTCGGSNGQIQFGTDLPAGSYTLNYVGAGSPQTVQVSGGTVSLTGLSAGTYGNFSITSGACILTAANSVTLSDPTAPVLGTPTLVHPNCQGETTGSLTLNPTGGQNPYSFTLSGGALATSSTGSFTGLGTGTYAIQISDVNSCTASIGGLSLTANALPTLSSVQAQSVCEGSPATVTLSGLPMNSTLSVGYTYGSSGPQTATVISSGAGVGSFQTPPLSASDAGAVTIQRLAYLGLPNSCSASFVSMFAALSITPYPTLTASVVGSNTLTCANASVVVNVTSSAMFVVSGPGNPVTGSTGFTATQPGTFTISTLAGAPPVCISQTIVTVNQSTDAPTISSFVSSNSLNCSLTSATLTAMASSTAPGTLTYAFSGTGITSQNASAGTAVIQAGGSFTVTVTNTANGCTATQTTTVNSNTTTPGVSIAPVSPTLTCANPTLSLTALSAGSTFRWTDNSTASTLPVSTTGTYSVTATGANGCISTTSVSVASNYVGPVPIPALTNMGATVCVGTNVAITASVSGPASTFQWFRNGQLAGSGSATLVLGNVQTAQAGSYVLVVTGGCGSATTTAFSLAINPLPDVTISFPNTATVNQNGGLPIITVPPFSPLTYQVFGGVNYQRTIVIDRVNGFEIRDVASNPTGIFPIVQRGLFQIVVTDANGCQRPVQGIIADATR